MARGAQLPSPGRRGRFGAPGARLSYGGTCGIFLVQRACLCPRSLLGGGGRAFPAGRAPRRSLIPVLDRAPLLSLQLTLETMTHQPKSDGGNTSSLSLSRACSPCPPEILTVKSLSSIFSPSRTLGAPSNRCPRTQLGPPNWSPVPSAALHTAPFAGSLSSFWVCSLHSPLDVPLSLVTFSCCHWACRPSSPCLLLTHSI